MSSWRVTFTLGNRVRGGIRAPVVSFALRWRADSHEALSAVQGFFAGRVRASLRTHARHQASLQELHSIPAAGRPHAGDGFREKLNAYPRLFRGGYPSAWRLVDRPQYR